MRSKIIRELEIPISLKDIPPLYVVNKEHLIDTLRVRVEDLGFEHLRYDSEGLDPIRLSLIFERGKPQLSLSKEELLQEVALRLSPTAHIINTSVKTIDCPLTKREKKKVAVRFRIEPTAMQGYAVTKLSLSPDSIYIYGDKKSIAQVDYAYLQSEGFQDLAQTISHQVKFEAIPSVYFDKTKALATIVVEELTQKILTLPVIAEGVPKGSVLRPLPSTVNVCLTFPRSMVNEVSNTDIKALVDYSQIAQKKADAPDYSLEVKLVRVPSFVYNTDVSPNKVQFVLEN